MIALGIDIGGTMIKTGIVDSSGSLSEKRLYETTGDLKNQILKIVHESRRTHRLEAIGIGTAGRVNPVTGSISLATSNLTNWSGVPIKRLVEKETGISTCVLNDANAAAFGEWFCNYPHLETLVMLTVGTGLGGGVVIGGRPLLGKRGEAAEFGHVIIHPGGKSCNCGKKGCAEQYVSMRLVHSLAAAAAGHEMDRATLIEQYLNGNPVVDEAVNTVAGDLAIVVDSVFLTFDPDLLVVGGGVCELGVKFLECLREKVEFLSRSSLYTQNEVVLSSSGNDAGIIGAALYAMNRDTNR